MGEEEEEEDGMAGWGEVCVLVGVREGKVGGMVGRLPKGTRVFVPYAGEKGEEEEEEEETTALWLTNARRRDG